MLKNRRICIVLLSVVLTACGSAEVSMNVRMQTETEAVISTEEPKEGLTEKPEGTKESETDVIESWAKESDDIVIPEVRVMFGSPSQEIPSAMGNYTLVKEVESKGASGGTTKQVTNACGADPILTVMEDGKEIPYVKLGTDLAIQFRNGSIPESIELEEMILNEDGSKKYDETYNRILASDNDKSELGICVDMFPTALLSSDSATYERGGVIRGFRMDCHWDNGSEAEYAWILRTDATKGEVSAMDAYDSQEPDKAESVLMAEIESVDDTKRGLSVLLKIQNLTDDTITYGEDFRVEKIVGDKTESMPMLENTGWNDIAMILEGKQSVVVECLVSELYGDLEPGEYIIRKELMKEDTGEAVEISEKFKVEG